MRWQEITEQDADAHMDALRRILAFLATDVRLATLRPRMTVFGSAAAGKKRPGDIDLYVDVSDHVGSYQHPSDVDGAMLLLALARKYYGKFDPFIRVGSILYARDEHAAAWVKAKNARAITKDAKQGKPLEDVRIDLAKPLSEAKCEAAEAYEQQLQALVGKVISF